MHLMTDTGSQAHFAQVPKISHSRNAFSLAVKHVTTIQFDYLYPLYWKFIYPGDTISGAFNMMGRLQTQIRTLYDDLYLDAHAWFVPFRLIQTNWARFQFNSQLTGPSQDNSSLTTPSIDLSTLGSGGFTAKSLYDYLGYPTAINLTASGHHINNYLARAYAKIWNDSYRDQNIQNATPLDVDDGPDLASDYPLLKRGKRHDKFTSCLTAQQKGTAATIPLGSYAPVLGIGKFNQTFTGTGPLTVYESDNSSSSYDYYSPINPGSNDTLFQVERQGSGGALFPFIRADLTAASAAANVNLLRSSIAVQHLLEADARGGTRDVESILHRWGVQVPDFRLDRSEYLGGCTFNFDGHLVPQTSSTSGSSYQAGLAQFSQTMSALQINHSFVEHGVFMILISARSNMTYQDGLEKHLSYRTRYDFYQPEFANLGEVAVLNKEIYIGATGATNDSTFGYQEYGYELRYQDNRVSGEMRSNYATSLDSKHMAYDFASLPTLASGFIESSTPISRNIAISAATADPIELNTMMKGIIARTLPMYSVPGLTRL